jgi:exoribonuclease R
MISTGVLILEGSKTYGKYKERSLYKCIPYKKTDYPILIPYEIKLEFSKHNSNKFVSYQGININQKIGQLYEVFGDVDDLNAFYEYQYVSRGLRFPKSLKKLSPHPINNSRQIKDRPIKDRRNEQVITIDNEKTEDYDDAFSIQPIENGYWKLSIYITNVVQYMTSEQWDKLREKVVSNIYLPHRKISILPSENVSLKEGSERYVIGIDIIMDSEQNLVQSQIIEAFVRIQKNHSYESHELLRDPIYQNLVNFSPKGLDNSHSLVAHWMEYYNTFMASILYERGIFVHHYPFKPTNFAWYKTKDNPKGYYFYDELSSTGQPYTHCTSPIRRIVDLYNQSVLLDLNWTPPDISFLNEKNKQIRKCQQDCSLMQVCFHRTEIMNTLLEGTILDVEKKGDNKYKYSVYIQETPLASTESPSLKLVTRMTSTIEYSLLSQHRFKLFLFKDEHSISKKIKVEIFTD